MSLDEFWHNDKRIFEACQKAYYRDLHEKAWLNGLYVNVAVQNTVANVMAKKGAKPLTYPSKPFDPFEKKQVVSKQSLESKQRSLQKAQSNFIRSLLNSK